jgi:hypothetical protein
MHGDDSPMLQVPHTKGEKDSLSSVECSNQYNPSFYIHSILVRGIDETIMEFIALPTMNIF